jgi:hypothetical protein
MDRVQGSRPTLPDGTYAEWMGLTHPIGFVVSQPATVDLRWAGPMPPPEGFEEAKPGEYWKLVPMSELTALFDLQTYCTWMGIRCVVRSQREDGTVDIAWVGGNQRRAEELGFEWRERGIFHRTVPESEVTDLHQERREIPLA